MGQTIQLTPAISSNYTTLTDNIAHEKDLQALKRRIELNEKIAKRERWKHK